jgi:GH3 auxin-responsive promoter
MAVPHRFHPRLMLNATPLLRLYAIRRLACLATLDPVAAQAGELLALVQHARETTFGRSHGFGTIRSVADYQARVPLRRWEDLWREFWQAPFPRLQDVSWPGLIPAFANTSGTTGAATKRIPVSRWMMRANRRAALDVLTFHLAAHPASRVLAGRNFILGGSTALEPLAPGIVAGDLSGIAADDIPWWARRRTFPPRELALIADWPRKIDALAPLSLAAHVTSFSGTPSWMLLFFEHLACLRPGAVARDLYPELELVVHGGVGFSPYRTRFQAWLEGSRAELREVYPASEGFIAIADRGDGDGLRLILDNGLFHEFVRPDDLGAANPDRRWIADVELGAEYALVLSSNAGLWSYVLGDTVTLIARNPPRLLVTGRTSWSLSVAGEHLTGQELDEAVAEAARTLGGTVADYSAAAIHPDAADPRGGHVFVIEADGIAADASEKLAAALDAALTRLNADYAAHRQDDYGFRRPSVVLAPPGTFATWMASRGKLGGQNKVPRVIGNPALLNSLRRAAGG